MTLQLQRILLPTDFSDHSSAAKTYASALASRFDAELHVLHILEQYYSLTPDFALGLALPRTISESKDLAKTKLSTFLDPQWIGCRNVVHQVVDGSPKAEIVRYARDQTIDLIVMSTHGRSALAQVMIGSVAESVVRTAPCPVLTVRPQGHQFVMP
ncbi:MAG: universal stress protein [Planctomycetota bacterium]